MNVMLSKTFFPQHPKAGEPTEFREKVLTGTKRHTCRCNYELFEDPDRDVKEAAGYSEPTPMERKALPKGQYAGTDIRHSRQPNRRSAACNDT